MRKFIFPRLLAASALALASSASLAHGPGDSEDPSLRSLVMRSDAIIYGTVIDITYKNSEPTVNSPKGLPHTFVTYDIASVLRGRITTNTLTLRLPGGADGEGGIYSVTTVPQFAYGQTDVLFIGETDESGCPLVGCVEGRFRVAGQQVYNGWGVPLASTEPSLVFGGTPRFDLNVMDVPSPTFDAVLNRPEVQQYLKVNGITTQAQLDQLRIDYDTNAPASYQIKFSVVDPVLNEDDMGTLEAEPITTYPAPIAIDVFLALIAVQNSQVSPPINPVVSADPTSSIYIVDPRVEPIGTFDESTGNMSEEERLDRELESANPDSQAF